MGEIMGKLITVEGTDCSGKETQTSLLVERLKQQGYKAVKFGLPFYDSPTGKIIAGPYLAKFGEGYFPEGAPNVPSIVASLYYTADRAYNANRVTEALEENDFVILDRYTHSNLAHHGSKIDNKDERMKFYNFINTLEFDMIKLARPDLTFFLHMPTENAVELRKGRAEKADQHEQDIEYLKKTEKIYLELTKLYGFVKIKCAEKVNVKSIGQINDEMFEKLLKLI